MLATAFQTISDKRTGTGVENEVALGLKPFKVTGEKKKNTTITVTFSCDDI